MKIERSGSFTESSSLELWRAYCDKKMQCENLTERVKELEEVLAIMTNHNCLMKEVYPESFDGVEGENLRKAKKLLEKE